MDIDTAIAMLEDHPQVSAVKGWNSRYYVNLTSAQRTFRGDTSAKLWLDSNGALNVNEGKGTRTTAFDDARMDVIVAFAAAGGKCIFDYPHLAARYL